MIHSKYILDILDLSFDEFEFEDLLRQQIPFLSEKDEKHTGSGLYIHFLVDKEIEKYKIPIDKVHSFDGDGNPTEMLNGVEIKNEELISWNDKIRPTQRSRTLKGVFENLKELVDSANDLFLKMENLINCDPSKMNLEFIEIHDFIKLAIKDVSDLNDEERAIIASIRKERGSTEH